MGLDIQFLISVTQRSRWVIECTSYGVDSQRHGGLLQCIMKEQLAHVNIYKFYAH
jgi:hypothetical protein